MDMYKGKITDIEGTKVGHAHDFEGMTGCTVVICEEGAVTGVDVRGGAPGTRETDLLKSENMIEKTHAILLSGGSAFGLDAATGVMKYLEEREIGFDVGVAKVPIVPAAVIFDLNVGNPKIRPDGQMGYQACQNATEQDETQGNVGCGLGATAGKVLGTKSAMKSGLGTASMNINNLWIGAIVVVNSFGNVYDYNSREFLVGSINKTNNKIINTYEALSRKDNIEFAGKNTTIGVIATNALLTKGEANKVAQLGHNGLARSINPIHTMFDGDTVFAMATGKVKADVNLVGTLASEVMSRAITNAVKSAKRHNGFYAWEDMKSFV